MIRPAPIILTAGQVANILGYSRAWFYKNRARLEAAGFPARIGPTRRWSRCQVEDWINSGGLTSLATDPAPAPPPAPPAPHGDNVESLSAWAEIARKRNRADYPDTAR